MFITVLTSIKLYLNLNNSINDEIALSKDFYILSISIFKILNLKQEDRGVHSLQFLNESYSLYVKLIEQSSLLRNNIKHDELTKIDTTKYFHSSSSSSSSLSSTESNILITNETTL